MIANGAYQHGPTPGRSSIGIDPNGTLHVTRFSFVGTWKGTGQRRPLAGSTRSRRATRPCCSRRRGGRDARLTNATAIVSNRSRPRRRTRPPGDGGPTSTGVDADPGRRRGTDRQRGTRPRSSPTRLPRGRRSRRGYPAVRLGGVTAAVGGGPLLVRTTRRCSRRPRTSRRPADVARRARGVGQLDDGRLVLVAVDGGRPGYSVGMTTYELAQTMARLGAVNAAGLQFGKFVTAAANGQLLNRPRTWRGSGR